MLCLVIDQVVLDRRRARGMVWMRIVWQTGAISEHWIRRSTKSYDQAAQVDLIEQRSRSRVCSLVRGSSIKRWNGVAGA